MTDICHAIKDRKWEVGFRIWYTIVIPLLVVGVNTNTFRKWIPLLSIE